MEFGQNMAPSGLQEENIEELRKTLIGKSIVL